MKKTKLSIIFLLFVDLLCGCQSKKNNYNIDKEELSLEYYTIKKDYDFSSSIEDGYVVYSNDGTVSNETKIVTFYNNYLANKDSILTIIRYTIEGDPIIIQYVYKNNTIYVYEDYTRDLYGSYQEITVKTIQGIEIEKDENNHLTIIEKCL